MDLNTVEEVDRPKVEAELPETWNDQTVWLAGGTWLFSEPQVGVTKIIDLDGLGWTELEASERGLTIGAMCPIASLHEYEAPEEWAAAPLFELCSRALLASFKIKAVATVGGNICRALPAGAMVTLSTALDGVATLLPRSGEPREIAVRDLVVAEGVAELQPGELLRRVFLPVEALRRKFAHRRIANTEEGRSMVFLIATSDSDAGDFQLTVTAATVRPFRLDFDSAPGAHELREQLDKLIGDTNYLSDQYRSADYRKHMTYLYAEELRQEFA